MPANFPDSPTVNQTYTYGTTTWRYTGQFWQVTDQTTVATLSAVTSNIVPASNIVYDLGSTTLRWRDLYLSGNTIDLGGTAIKSSAAGISFSNSANAQQTVALTVSSLQIASATGNVVTLQASATGLQTVGTTGNVVATTPGGSSSHVQYNFDGAFAGSANLTFSGTTLTMAANPVLSAGTANGVLYLNAGKAATSGSALTFDGTNLGVGTSSPTAQLQLNKTGTSDYTTFRLSNSGASGKTYEIGVGGNASAAGYANNLYFYDSTAGANRMVIDGSGNLGLGVAPSAWRSVWRALQFGNSGALFARTDTSYSVNIGGNIFNNASNQDIYINSSFATIYQQSSGEHRWLTAPSGTAGNAITFTQAMTLDSSGRLLVGVTSSQGNGSRLQIGGGTQYFGSQGTNGLLSSTSYFNTNSIGFEIAKLDVSTGGNIYEGVFQFYTKDSGGTMAERARIDSSGNVGIGTSTPSVKLDVRGTSATSASTIQVVGNSISTLLLGQNADGGVIRGQGGNNCLTFWTGGTADMAASGSGTERLRIANDGTITAKAAVRFDHAGQLSSDVFLPTVPGGTPVIYGRGGSDLVQLTGNGTTYKIVATRNTTQADYSIFYILLWRKPTGSNYTPPIMTFHGELCAHRGNELGVSRMSYVYASRGYNASNYSTVTTLHGGTIGFSSNITWNGGTYCGFYVDTRGGAGILFWDIDAVFTYNDSGSQGNVLDQFLVTFSSTTLQHS